jgi:pimeloyl-ACP methyl ester carboxylesterase
MPVFESGGVSLAYDDVGPPDARDCVVLLHGFATNRNENWRRVGWLGAFERRRIRALAFDMRGHGESGRPHAPEAYSREALLGDVVAFVAAFTRRPPILMGYSMGARLALAAASAHPDRFERLILGGVGGRLFEPAPPGHPMADAMEAADADAIAEPLLRSFRIFADDQGEDRLALAAFARARAGLVDQDALGALRLPTLVVAGARDELAGDVDALAVHIPGARGITLPGCDHFSAIAHASFKGAVFDFLDETAM